VIYNEQINAVRLALRSAIDQVQEFSDQLSDLEIFRLMQIVFALEGAPFLAEIQHDPALYDKVRKLWQNET
jgi:hypothetical protein